MKLGDGVSGANDGSLAGNVNDNATLVFANVNDRTYLGAIGGTGVVNKVGAGALYLSGTNGYSGATTVTLGDLRGTGTLSNSTVVTTTDAGAASVWPGVSKFGVNVPMAGETLTVKGLDLSQGTAHGVLKIALNSSSAVSTQLLAVTGTTCNLAGGILELGIADNSTNKTLTILTSSSNAITGTFANIRVNGTSLGATPTAPVTIAYTTSAVTITINAAVTPVTIESFTAQVQGAGVKLTWNCVSEFQNAGFNVYRRAAGDDTTNGNDWSLVNATLITGRVTNPDAKVYQLYDWAAPGVYEYKLESLSIQGDREVYHDLAGPVTIDDTTVSADTPNQDTLTGVFASVDAAPLVPTLTRL